MTKDGAKLTVPETAKILRVSTNSLRSDLRQGLYSWGEAIRRKSKTKSGNPTFKYIVYGPKFCEAYGFKDVAEARASVETT